MIGINSINLMSLRQPRKFFDPIRLEKCIAWYDFTDVQSIFTNVEGTARPSDGAEIKRVNNKAYWARAPRDSNHNTGDNAIGKFVMQSSAGKYPTWDNTNKCLSFDGSNDFLYALHSNDAAVDTNKLADVTSFVQTSFTCFVVFKSDNASGSISSDNHIFALHDIHPGSVGMRIDNSGSDDEIFGNISNADRTAGAENDFDSGIDATANKEFWTFGCGGSSSSGLVYRNGNTSNGITNGTVLESYTMNFSGNSNQNKFYIGSNGAGANVFDGLIYELIIYYKVLNSFELKQVHEYLSNKHKIEIG